MTASTRGSRGSLFRREATLAMQSGAEHGVPLALSPGWIRWCYRLIVGATLAAVAFAVFARVGDYARGPAVVRVLDRLDLTTATSGIVLSVDVEPGAHVAAGELLVRFHAQAEQRELAQVEREFELKLVRLLLSPHDDATRSSLASLRAAREMAAERLAERQVVAPRAGVVRNLRIRPGQLLGPGDVVLTLVDESRAEFSVLALVPGQFRPMLRAGMPLRFSLEGHPQAASDLVVEQVGDEVVGPNEMRRFLGQELGDTLPVSRGRRARTSTRPPSTGSVRPSPWMVNATATTTASRGGSTCGCAACGF